MYLSVNLSPRQVVQASPVEVIRGILRRLPVLLVKIDRSFVTGIEDDPQAHTVAEAVVRLGAAFRLTVVAEGIGTAEQATALRDMGCEFGQDFYFHRPLDGETAARTLREAYRGQSIAPVSRGVP
jgi:EAL domain-containing protein (putative c-di-GMP-specific phosphodiesterase class I)